MALSLFRKEPTVTEITVDDILSDLNSKIDALVALEAGKKAVAEDKRKEAHEAIIAAEAAEFEAQRALKIAENIHNLLNPK